MEREELSFKLHQIITSACDRDMLSGWGGIVYIVDKDGVHTEFLKTKQSWWFMSMYDKLAFFSKWIIDQ